MERKGRAVGHRRLQIILGQAKSAAIDLHRHLRRRASSKEHNGNADEAFLANNTGFAAHPFGILGNHRTDASGWEIGVIHRFIGLMENFFRRKIEQLKARCQSFKISPGQQRKQPVFNR
jgi:hypothetical protein